MTTIQDTVYNAAGVPANGQIVIDSPPFTLNGVSVAASQITTPIVNGVLNVQLFPNMNAQPTGVYYTARYELDQGPVFEEYWVVPNQPTVNLGQVRVSFPATPSVMINAQQLTSAGALPGQFLGWSGGNWVPMYVTSFNYYPNFINLYLTGIAAADLSVTGSPASLGAGFTLNVPDAGQASRGVVTTGPQTFSGNKVFANNVAITGSLVGPNAQFTDLTVAGQLLATGQSNLLLDPTTTLGDLIARGQNAPPTRFAAGSNGTVLTADSNQPLGLRWGPPPVPDPTTQTGDLLVRGPGSAIVRLGVGSNGQVLTADSSQLYGVAWEAAAGGVPATRMIATGLGLTGGGNLSQDLLLSVVPDTTNQQVMVLLDGGAPIATRHAINFIEGANVTLVIRDDPTNNWIDVTIASTGGPLPPGTVTSVFGRNGDVVATAGDYTADLVTYAVDTRGMNTGTPASPNWVPYPNPTWIGSLDYGKLINVPTQFPPASHTHDASAIVSGIIAPARLGTGTANNGVFLRGDSVWAVTTGQPQSPWAQTILGAGQQLQNAGWIGVGTSTIPIQSPIAGRAYITIRGTTDAGVIELATGSADADQTLIGRVAYTDIANTQADKRSAFIDAYRSGAVVGNRGSALAFWTRPDGGSTPVQSMMLSNQGRLGVGTLNPGYTIDVVGDVNVSGCYRMGTSAFACPDSGGGGGIDLSNIVMINGSAPGGFWQAGGGGVIYYNGGHVGIGTATPDAALTVAAAPSYSSGAGNLNLELAGNAAYRLYMGVDATLQVPFIQSNQLGVGWLSLLLNPNGGAVGVGTTTPLSGTALHVNGPVHISGPASPVLNSPSSVSYDFSAGYARAISFGPNVNTAGGFAWINVRSDNSGAIFPMVITPAGFLGVGTGAPQAVFHAVGASGDPGGNYGTAVVAGGDAAHQVRIGYNASSNFGWIQSVQDAVAQTPLSINGAGGAVGIGCAYGIRTLTIQASTYTGIELVVPGHTAWYIDNRGAVDTPNDRFAISAGAQDLLTILPSGNVGILSASPEFTFTVDNSGAAPTVGIRSGGYLILRPATNSWDMRLQSISSPANALCVYSGGDLSYAIATFQNGGNVGIGNAGPIGKLDVLCGTGQYAYFRGNANGVNPSAAFQGQGGVCFSWNRSGGAAEANLIFSGNLLEIGHWDGGTYNATVQITNNSYLQAYGGIGVGGAGFVGGSINVTGNYYINGAPITSGGPTVQNAYGSGGRAIGTTYQNGTGKAMYVAVSVGCNSGFGAQALVDGGNPPGTQVAVVSMGSPAGSSVGHQLFFVVLPGYFYRVVNANNLFDWTEWY